VGVYPGAVGKVDNHVHKIVLQKLFIRSSRASV
jgi:hypothetical protein